MADELPILLLLFAVPAAAGGAGALAFPLASLKGTTTGKEPLEAFSDGVIAIIITIMVLEMKIPYG